MKPTRDGTPGLGVAVLDESKNYGRAYPVDDGQRMAEVINEVAKRAAEKACENGNIKRAPDTGVWIRWSAGIMVPLLVLIIGAWIALGERIADRTTEAKVEKLIENRKPHSDLKELSATNARLIQQQAVDLAAIKTGIDGIQKSITELKNDKPTRRDR